MCVSLLRDPAMVVNKEAIGNDKLVYFMVADKKIKYPTGRSRIVYIGTTKNGASRFARSAASRADDILGIYGIRRFEVRVATCKPSKRIKSWIKLERAFLLAFREEYGDVPHCNSQGSKMKVKDEYDYFARNRIRQIIDDVG